jgi:hypothetical protein
MPAVLSEHKRYFEFQLKLALASSMDRKPVWGAHVMAIRNSSGDKLLPSADPSISFINSVPVDVQQRISNYPTLQRRAVFWTFALAEVLEHQPYYGKLNLLPSFGFLDPDIEMDAFGVILHEIHSNSAYRTGRSTLLEARLPELKIDGFTFPVFVRRSELKLQTSHLHPNNGRGACMTKDEGNREGILTAEHVVGTADKIDILDDAGVYVEQGTVLATAGGGVDAANIGVSKGRLGNSLATVNPVAQWMDIELGAQQGKVVSVTDNRGVLGRSVPSRVFTSVYGSSGDSGSPVREVHGNQNLAGIYMGQLQNIAASATEGCCQHAAQAEHVLGLALFEGT